MNIFDELDFREESINKAIESFKKKETGDGKRGPFYNGEIPKQWPFKVENEELFKKAVWQGYLDASRTFYRIKNTKNNKMAFDKLALSIQNYFRGKEEFNHNNWCEVFIKNVNNNNNYEPRYGQAQKVVNMAFKYLYCCEGAEKYKDKFKPCHMPLDQYTLLWFFFETGKWYQEWSWFNANQYNEVEEEIKKQLKEDILGKELVIWQRISEKEIINLKDTNKQTMIEALIQ